MVVEHEQPASNHPNGFHWRINGFSAGFLEWMSSNVLGCVLEIPRPGVTFNFATGCWSLFSRTGWNWVESTQPSTFTRFPLAAQQVQLSPLTSALYCWMNEAQWTPSIARWPWRSLEAVCGLSLTILCVWRLACHLWPPGPFLCTSIFSE